MEIIAISTDKSLLDLELIHNFFKDSYWAKGRTMEKVKKTIENSFCFGIYENGAQVGFANPEFPERHMELVRE